MKYANWVRKMTASGLLVEKVESAHGNYTLQLPIPFYVKAIYAPATKLVSSIQVGARENLIMDVPAPVLWNPNLDVAICLPSIVTRVIVKDYAGPIGIAYRPQTYFRSDCGREMDELEQKKSILKGKAG